MAAKWLWACLLGMVAAMGVAPLRAEIVYVDSAKGNDAGSGRQGDPVRTIARAAQIVNRTEEPGPTTIRIAPGAYGIDETVTFDAVRRYTAENRLVCDIPAIFWDAEGGVSRGNAMRHCIVDGADIVWMYEELGNADLYVAPAGKHGHHTDQIEAFGPVLLRFLNRIHSSTKGG